MVHVFDSLDVPRPYLDQAGNMVATFPGGPVMMTTEHIGRGRFRIHDLLRRRITREVQAAIEQAERTCVAWDANSAAVHADHVLDYPVRTAPALHSDV